MDNDLHATTEIPIDLPWNLLEEMTNGFSENQKIGTGAYGVVYKGVHPNGQEIAVKKLHLMPALDGKEFQNELQNLTRLDHRNIVRLVGKCDEQQDRCIEYKGKMIVAQTVNRAICLEYLHNGSLEKHLSDESSGLTWHERYEIIKGTCEGLKYLHSQGIFHLDLKPANILLDKNMMPKIADFGLSRLYTGTHRSHTTKNFIGTIGYMPPEFIQKGKISEKFDVFSLGVIIIKIVAGQDGYSKHSDMSSQDFIELVHGNWRNRFTQLEGCWEGSSHMDACCQQVKTCTRLALSCVEADRQRRPCIGDIIQSLNGTEILLGNDDVSYNHHDELFSGPAADDAMEDSSYPDYYENPRKKKPRRGGDEGSDDSQDDLASLLALDGHLLPLADMTSEAPPSCSWDAMEDISLLQLGVGQPRLATASHAREKTKRADAVGECWICGLGFETIQALFEHMRCHDEEQAPPVLLQLI
ncbi:hypothetical protein ACP4OV_011908 [Aristida adscensionis]